jgi:hypothetical protein
MQPNYLTNASVEAAISVNGTEQSPRSKRRYLVTIIALLGLLIGAATIHANRAEAADTPESDAITQFIADNLAFENLRSLIAEDFRSVLISLNLDPRLTGDDTFHDNLSAVPVELNEGTTIWVFFVDPLQQLVVSRENATGYILIMQNSNDLSNLFTGSGANFSRNITESTPAVYVANINLGAWVQGVGFTTPYNVLVLRG